MANSAIVGALRVLLGLDTAEFEAGVTKAKGQAAGLESEFKKFGSSFAGAFLPVASIAGAGVALASFAKTAFDTAGQISDLADQTGLTTDSIQEMQAAASLTGTSLESFTNAAFKLGVNLETGTDKIRNAVEALGLSYKTLREQSPDEQFRTIATALGEVEDVQLRNKLAVELFGKAAKEILPAIAQNYDQIAGSAAKAGKAQIEAMDGAGDAITRFWTDTKTIATNVLGGIVIGFERLETAMNESSGALHDAFVVPFEVLGAKAAELPKIFKAATVAAGQLPKPLGDITMSLDEMARAEKDADKAAKDSLAANLKAAEERKKTLADQASELRSFYNWLGERQMEAAAGELRQIEEQQAAWRAYYNWLGERRMEDEALTQSFRERFSSSIDLGAMLEPFKAAVEQQKPVINEWAKTWEDVVSRLPNVILGAIQGGGSVLNAAGALIGTSLMEKFQKTFGPAIEAALPFGIGKAITSLLPTLGTLFGPVAKKIGDFFRNIFGGPSDEEKRGREAVADFEADLHKLLNQTQLNEAGNEDWKKTVIAIRDAYLAAGKTEEEAMAAAKRLWESSTKGAAETEAAIKAIQDVLDQTTSKSNALAASLDDVFRDRTLNVDVNGPEPEGPGWAVGTMGRAGQWFRNFPQSGMATALHGMEAVIRPEQAVPFAADVLAGLGASAAGPGSSGSPTIINNHFDFDVSTLDTDELSRLIRRRIMPEINAQLSNVGELRTGMRDGLGV